MTDEQKAAYVIGNAVAAHIEAMAMSAENKEREIQGNAPAYTGGDFDKLINKYGIHHNAMISLFHGGEQ